MRLRHDCWSVILKILRIVSQTSLGFQIVCDAYQRNERFLQNSFNLFIYGLGSKGMALNLSFPRIKYF